MKMMLIIKEIKGVNNKTKAAADIYVWCGSPIPIAVNINYLALLQTHALTSHTYTHTHLHTHAHNLCHAHMRAHIHIYKLLRSLLFLIT